MSLHRWDTDFLSHIRPKELLESLLYPKGRYIPVSTHLLELYSFIPQIFTKHLQRARHLSRSCRRGSEQNNSTPCLHDLPSASARSVTPEPGTPGRTARGCWSLGKALRFPSPNNCIPTRSGTVIEHLLHARA